MQVPASTHPRVGLWVTFLEVTQLQVCPLGKPSLPTVTDQPARPRTFLGPPNPFFYFPLVAKLLFEDLWGDLGKNLPPLAR